MDTTPNRRVQKLLDAATQHGWTTEHPSPELATWLVYPRQLASDGGFVVHDLPNGGARVLRADSYKPVTQREALAAFEANPQTKPEPEPVDVPTFEEIVDQAINLVRQSRRVGVEDIGHTVHILPSDDSGDVVVMSEFAIPEGLDAREKSDFCEGALLAATTVARLLEESLDASMGLVPDEVKDNAVVSPASAAHAYLFLAAQLRDPKTVRLAFKDQPEPNRARLTGAQMICKGLTAVWTAFADGLFALDGEGVGAPLAEFMSSLHEHAEFIRSSADESFGPFITASDDDFESLLR
jgi:hypothetical protein